MTETDRQLFSKLVLEAVNVLSEEFADKIENVDVTVKDQPDERNCCDYL
jgi:predicted Zn-dependent protease with MMP-like domain